jgi:DNA-binding NarL/FixJ family response regulator
VHQIRVVLAQLPTMLRDILSDALADQSDILLVGEAPWGAGASAAQEQADADVMITGLDMRDSRDLCESLLRRHSGLTVFSIPEDGSGVYGWTLRLHGEPLGDVSAGGLITAIRLATRRPMGGG